MAMRSASRPCRSTAAPGYCKDYPVEQYARDCKITSIFEGTSGIQSMDLLARKLGMKKGQVFMAFMTEIQKVVARAKEVDELKSIAETLETAVNRLGEVAMHMGKKAMSPDFKVAFAHSVPFLETMGDVIMGWMLLWRAQVAATQLNNGAKKKDESFYKGQISSARFFMETLIPVTFGKMDAIKKSSSAAIDIDDDGFGGL